MLYLTVPSPAQNVSISSNGTHITITWKPPSQPNGVVNYTVLLLETNLVQNTTVVITSEEVTDLLLVVPFMAEPYREYVAMVTAQTGAGVGESAKDMLTTPEGGTILSVLDTKLLIAKTFAEFLNRL